MKTVIVTGGAGFIGSAFVWKLNQEGIDDILIVDDLGTGEKWKNLVGLRYSDYLPKNIFLQRVAADNLGYVPDTVVHMGACSSTIERNAGYLMENNYRYTRTLAEWAVLHGIRFLYASSASTYGNGEEGFGDHGDLRVLRPLNMYGYSKHLFDLHAQRTGLLDAIVGLKFFNVFGPNEYHKGDMASLVFKAFKHILETGRVKLFKAYRDGVEHGEQMRDFIYIKDCLQVMWWLMIHDRVNGLFNLGTGRARSWNDLSRSLFMAMARPCQIEFIEMPKALRESYQYFTQAELDRLGKTGCPLDFRPLEESVRDYVVNYLQTPNPHLASPCEEQPGFLPKAAG